LYKQAFQEAPIIESKALTNLISKDKNLQSAINKAKGFAAYADLPDNSIEVLHHAKQLLDDQIASAGSREARLLQKTQKALVDEIENAAPTYKQAKDTFASLSQDLNRVEKSKVNFLATLDPEDANKIGRVFELPTSVIESLRDDYKAAGKLDEWEAGVRAFLQNNVETVADRTNPINKLMGSVSKRNKLKAALGDKYEVVIKDLETEQRIFRGTQEYRAASPTTPLAQQEEALKSRAQRLSSFLLSPKQSLQKLALDVLSPSRPEQFYQDYARLLFTTPEQGLETLGRIKPLVEALTKSRQAGEAVARGAQVATSRGIEPFTQTQPKPTPKSSSALGIGAVGLGMGNEDLLNEILNYAPAEQPAVESVKVGKQNISIPQGEQFAPPTLVKAVMQVESAGKPKAVSPKGAAGLMQLMPGTAKDLGVTDRFDPQQNVEGGSKYLQQQLSKFGDSKLALAAYNWGPDNLQRAIARTKKAGLKPTWENILDTVFVPKETQKYVNKVLTIQSALA
jgi:ParB-like chromosome segregation protein Spo0J